MKANTEKLTHDKIYLNSIIFGVNCNFIPQCGEERTKEATEFLRKAFDRLAELEDKLEQNIIIELPCKRGDTVYFIQSAFSLTAFPIDSKVTSIRGINCDYEVMYSAITNYNKLDRTFTSADIGKTVFLTESEAQAELERRTNG